MADASALPAEIRHDWSVAEVEQLFALPFNDLMFRAQSVHRAHFPANQVQLSTLLSIKTGGCPEDCAYCPQAARYDTGVEAEKLMKVEAVIAEARRAKEAGASRYCMGAAWREPKDRDLDAICDMVQGVKALGLETCMTLGMLTAPQADRLKEAGLDYYNPHFDTSPEYYGAIITTRTYQDRLDTLAHVRDAGINVCSGGIVGMGEGARDRAGMLVTLGAAAALSFARGIGETTRPAEDTVPCAPSLDDATRPVRASSSAGSRSAPTAIGLGGPVSPSS